jgi:predicted DNA-binding transcriptional regulator AlpA
MLDDDRVIFVRKAEAARRFGVTTRTLERWELAGTFPRRVQIGPLAVGYRAADLQRFAESRQYAQRKADAIAAAGVIFTTPKTANVPRRLIARRSL